MAAASTSAALGGSSSPLTTSASGGAAAVVDFAMGFESPMELLKGKKWKKMWCSLTFGMLTYAETKGGTPSGTLCLQDCNIERTQNCIVFKSPSREYTFKPESMELVNRWLLALRQLCDRNGKTRHHSFRKTAFHIPVTCTSCEKLVWGLGKPGFSCYACRFQIHLKCISNPNVVGSCAGYTDLTTNPSLEEMLVSPSELQARKSEILARKRADNQAVTVQSQIFAAKRAQLRALGDVEAYLNMSPIQLADDMRKHEEEATAQIRDIVIQYEQLKAPLLDELMLREIEEVDLWYAQLRSDILAELTLRGEQTE
ncbi:hypothetical protein Pelo_1045 [Pelomyxa schiedti]|nr:hypothetical protein Pelo_1045 [Pelomyxa schiedti]